MSAGAFANWIHSPFDRRKGSEFHNFSSRCKSSFGSNQHNWLRARQESSLSKVSVAADYSDSLPESTDHFTKHGYHPLEEYKEPRRKRDLFLPDVELAKTIVETNHKAVLVFAGWLQYCQPHGHSLWSEFEYRIDDHGAILFELPDEGLLHDLHAPYFHVRVLIGMDSPFYNEKGTLIGGLNDDYIHDKVKPAFLEDQLEEEYYYELLDRVEEVTSFLMERGMPETLQQTHPLHFVKCLEKVVNTRTGNKRAWPSNVLSIVGTLESCKKEDYLWRNLFHPSDYDGDHDHKQDDVGYESDWSDGEAFSYSLTKEARSRTSTLYKLKIGMMELFSVFGKQTEVHHRLPFHEVEPDYVACSAREIIERLDEYGTNYLVALRALCRKKKGLIVDKAEIIGVDSLGFDVRAFLGMEMKALRFSFNSRAMTEKAAEKKIMRMLFTRSKRKQSQNAFDDV
ncbi:hypothetical protein LUZ63_003487 [Rhynchospora breviuscula]|uniref:Uncharacterized protein n=1 Tax=Rhynchospora breviuscula TaxID=2022672 RepID=A0A9Q0HZZ7_9POAL|nr:hypothetical protein LUZ63_003487 [Rhynchospora breviuscula]